MQKCLDSRIVWPIFTGAWKPKSSQIFSHLDYLDRLTNNWRYAARNDPTGKHQTNMRQIGTIEGEERLAACFVDYLKTMHIAANAEQDGDGWIIWVKDENHIDSAKSELAEFVANPGAEQYRDVSRRANEIRAEEINKKIQVTKNFQKVGSNWNTALSKRAPVVMYLIIACIAAAVLGGGFGTNSIVDKYLKFADMTYAREAFANPFRDILTGQVWRLVTPIFLHGGLIHILFNLYWLYQLGAQIEARLGSRQFLMLVLATAIFSNVLQATLVGPNFVGISGVVYGLFGYILVRRNDGYRLDPFVMMLFLVFFILDFTPMRMHSNVAVWAHAGGLASGAFIGYLPKLLR